MCSLSGAQARPLTFELWQLWRMFTRLAWVRTRVCIYAS